MGDFKIKEIKNYMMTGISYLIPVCIIGGMFFAISIGFGGEYVQDQGIVVANQFLANLQTIGSSGLFIMIPVVGAYIAYAIAGKPALAPAFVLCYMANIEVGATATKTGFLGALLLGLATGIMVSYLKKIKWPDMIKPIVPIIIIPLVTVFVLGMTYIHVLLAPLSMFVNALTGLLEGLSTTSMILVAVVIGIMLAVDMGGPINKTCTLFLYMMAETGRYEFFAFLAAGACIPAIGMGIATFISKKRYTENERVAGITSFIMGCMGLTEGAIPLAAVDPARVIPSICVGGAVGNALVYLFGCINYCPHGGFIVIPAITGKLGYVIAVLAGSAVTAIMVNLLKKPVQVKAADNRKED